MRYARVQSSRTRKVHTNRLASGVLRFRKLHKLSEPPPQVRLVAPDWGPKFLQKDFTAPPIPGIIMMMMASTGAVRCNLCSNDTAVWKEES